MTGALGRVLVVDDETELLDTLIEALCAQGYSAAGFQTGEAALQALQSQDFDLLLTDLMMPGMDGITLLRAGLSLDPNLVGIIMTGQGTVPTAVEAMKTGAFDYILKPFRMDSILPVLARAKEVRRLRVENIQLRETVAIYNLSQVIAFSLDSRLVLENTADAVMQQTDADEVSIMLLTPDQQSLYIAAVRGQDRQHLLGERISLQEGIASWVARHSEPLILNGGVKDPRFLSLRPRAEICSAITMPMLAAGKLIGVLNVNSLQRRHPFTLGQVKALSILTSTAAAALENEALYATLEASERRFRALVENSGDGVALLDPQGRRIYTSPAVKNVLGYSPEQLMGQESFELVYPEDQERVIAQFHEVVRNPDRIIHSQFRIRHKDNSWRWVDATAQNMLGEPGVEAIVVNYRDITRRKEAEDALRQAEEKYRTLVERIPAITYIAPAENASTKLYMSPQATQILGFSQEEISNGSDLWSHQIYPEDRPQLLRELEKSERERKPFVAEYRMLAKDGRLVWINDTADYVRDENYRPLFLQGIMLDITERKHLEEQLRQKDATLRSFYESAPSLMGITEIVGDSDILHVYDNPATCGFFGVEVDSTNGKLGSELGAPPSALAIWIQNYWESERTGSPVHFEYLHQDGKRCRWLSVTVAVIRDASPRTRFCYVAEEITERKQAEAALEASEKRFRTWIENSSDLISVLDLNGTILYESPSIKHLLGYDPEQMLGLNVFSLLHPDDQPQVRALFEDKNNELGRVSSAVYRVPHQDGTWRYFEALGRSYIDEHGDVVALVHSRDITQRKQAEAAVAAMQKRFQALIENAPDGIALLGLDGKLRQVTPSTYQLLGYTLQEADGQDPTLMTHPEDLPTVLGLLNALIQTPGQVGRITCRFKHKDGTWRWLESTISNLIAEPSVEAIVFNYRDITERKQAEEKIILQANLLGAVGSAAIATDLEGRVIYWNPAAEKLFGWTSEDAVGRPVMELTIHQQSQEQAQEIMKQLQAGNSWSGEFLLQRRDGSSFPGFVSDSPLLDSDGNLIGIIGVSNDITELKKVESALRLSEQRYRELAENFPNGVVSVYNKDLVLVFDAGLELKNFGYTAEDFLGKHFTELLPPETCEIARPHLLAAFEGRVSAYEVSGLNDQYYSVNVAPLRNAEGQITEILVVSQNITSLRHAQSALKEKERLLSEAQRIGHIGSWSYDIPADAVKFSDEMYRLLDVAPEVFQHTSGGFLALIYPSDRGAVTTWLRNIQRGVQSKEINFRIFRKNGELRYLQCTGAVSLDGNGRADRFIGMVQDVTDRKVAEMEIEQHIRRLTAISTIDRAIISSTDQRYTLDVIISQVLSQLHVDASSIWVVDASGELLDYAAGKGFRTGLLDSARIRVRETLAGRAVRDRRMVHVSELQQNARGELFSQFVDEEGFVTYFAMPLVVKGSVKGVLEVYQRTVMHPYPEWLDFLETLAGQAAIAIDNAAMFKNLQATNDELIQAYEATIEGWSRAMDLRDRETEGHTQRVTALTLELSQAMGMDKSRLAHIRRGALLHDIGKLGVPDQILFKTGELTPEEWEIMKKHTEFAYEMLSSIHYLKPALNIPYFHHEKWDGSGYPLGLKGEQIPLEARIFAVIDVWDALRSDRPYRQAWEPEKVREYITKHAGDHFDPKVVECFLRIIH